MQGLEPSALFPAYMVYQYRGIGVLTRKDLTLASIVDFSDTWSTVSDIVSTHPIHNVSHPSIIKCYFICVHTLDLVNFGSVKVIH